MAIPYATNPYPHSVPADQDHTEETHSAKTELPWEGRKVPTKSLFEQEAPKTGTQKCSTKRGVREHLNAEFALNGRELVKAEVFEKRVFEQTAPLK